MKIFSKKHIQWAIFSLLFAGTVVAIFSMFPHSAHFSMHYELNKPWNHELLTAPFDFSIYKSDAELAAEKDSVRGDFSYYIPSPIKGVVQKGEKIIDRGEIVSNQQFDVLNSLAQEYGEQGKGKNNVWVKFGEFLLITGLLFLFALYIYLFRPEFISVKNVLFFILMINLIVGSASLILNYSVQYVNIVPFALLAIIVRIFFDSRTALFVHIITVLIVSLFVETSYLFVLLHIPAGMVAIYSLKELTHRSQLVKGAIFIFINYSLIYLCFTLIDSGSISNLEWEQFKYFFGNAVLLLFAYILIYIFEKIFNYLSDVTLVELSNINNKLLSEYSTKAPGSFQHTMQVSTLAAAVASKIGANTLLARTGALYHDIGKMRHPLNFTENQNGGNNPLNEKPLEEAAQMIIAHVADGVKIAEQNGLPTKVVNFIKSHHAKSVARYFYITAVNNANGAEVDITKFSYQGQLPASKEEAILMMTDAVEAASRSLKMYNEETIGNLVENIINTQIAEHSLKNAPITFRDVEIVKRVLKTKLLNIYHTRISYPTIETKS